VPVYTSALRPARNPSLAPRGAAAGYGDERQDATRLATFVRKGYAPMIRKLRALGGLLCLAAVLTVAIILAIGHPPMAARPRDLPRALRPAAVATQTIVVLGDSVAYGAYDVVRGGWVTRLDRLLAAAYPRGHPRVRNLARKGGNTADLLVDVRRLRRGAPPALVLIAYGLNDFDERIPATVLAAHLRVALRLLRSGPRPPAVVFMGMPPITALSPARQRVERAYTDVIRHVAAAGHAGYLDEFDLWLALGDTHLHSLRHDTEHPNRFGYAFTAATVAAFLDGSYLDSRGRVRSPLPPPTCAPAVCGP